MIALVSGMMPIPKATGAYVDCTLCHLDPPPDSAAKDYTEYYSTPKREHRVGIDYPHLPNSGYNQPNDQVAGIRFFDTNSNGVIDANEIQLFGVTDKVECSSRHLEHGDSPPPAQPNMYLRITNIGSALCRVCHGM